MVWFPCDRDLCHERVKLSTDTLESTHFWPMVPFMPLKTPENQGFSWCFQGLQNGNIEHWPEMGSLHLVVNYFF